MQPEDAPEPDLVVMTGDIVGSSRMRPSELDTVMDALRDASREVTRQWGDGEPRFTRFRGDGWQCLGPTPERWLRAVLLMRAHVRRLGSARDTRISVAVGPGLLPAEPSLAAASGPVFALSGHGLDNMPHVRRFALAWTEPPGDAALRRAIVALADEVSRRWTPRQAEVLALLLAARSRPSQEALADELGIRQQVVARHLAAGGDWALQEALSVLEGGA